MHAGFSTAKVHLQMQTFCVRESRWDGEGSAVTPTNQAQPRERSHRGARLTTGPGVTDAAELLPGDRPASPLWPPPRALYLDFSV